MYTVLVVEDCVDYYEIWEKRLSPKVKLFFAPSIREAETQFANNPDGFDAIVMDACVPGDTPNTLELVREFRKTFEGPMLANSNSLDYQAQLLEAGCDYSSVRVKRDMPEDLLEIFQLS